MMLEYLGTEYKDTLDAAEGPRIDIIQNGEKKRILIADIEGSGIVCPEYKDRIKQDIKNALKKEGGDGCTYSSEQRKLMVWYTYLFLNRGKPSTHIAALFPIK